ncbi:MAG: hypothetical protein AB7U79_00880 [Candidatus Izemoplasmatales bacterium]
MLYIISGVAKSGKTYLSKYIIDQYHIPYFSTDYLMMSLSLSGKETGVDHTLDDEIVATSLEPYLYPMLRAMVENGIDYLIEGVHFNPSFASKLLHDFKDKIQFIYLGYSEVSTEEKTQELRNHINDFENPWFSHLSSKEMIDLIDYLKNVSRKIKNQATSLHIPYVEVYNIVSQKEEIIRLLSLC